MLGRGERLTEIQVRFFLNTQFWKKPKKGFSPVKILSYEIETRCCFGFNENYGEKDPKSTNWSCSTQLGEGGALWRPCTACRCSYFALTANNLCNWWCLQSFLDKKMDKAPKLELLSVFLKSIVLLNLKKVFFMVCVEKGKKIEDDSACDSNRTRLS